MKKFFFLVFPAIVFSCYVTGQTKISIDDGAKYIGQTVTICDKVYRGDFVENSQTLLSLGGVYPHNKLTVLINADKSKNFSKKIESFYPGKNICVTGKLINFKGKPEIIVSSGDQVLIQASDDGIGDLKPNDITKFFTFF